MRSNGSRCSGGRRSTCSADSSSNASARTPRSSRSVGIDRIRRFRERKAGRPVLGRNLPRGDRAEKDLVRRVANGRRGGRRERAATRQPQKRARIEEQPHRRRRTGRRPLRVVNLPLASATFDGPRARREVHPGESGSAGTTPSHEFSSLSDIGSKNEAGISNTGRPGSGPIGLGSARTSSNARSSATGLLWRQMTMCSPWAARSRSLGQPGLDLVNIGLYHDQILD